jgi:hypothetical protein
MSRRLVDLLGVLLIIAMGMKPRGVRFANDNQENREKRDSTTTANYLDVIASYSTVREAFEQIHAHPTSFLVRYRVFSRHNKDIWIFMIIYCIIFVGAAFLVLELGVLTSGNREQDPNADGPRNWLNPTTLNIVFGAAIFGGFIGVISRLIENAQKRLGTVDLFTSEILSIGQVFTSSNIVGAFVQLYDRLARAQPEQDTVGPGGFADVARKESYSSVFDKNNSDLGHLSSDVVSNITAFYTFFKASRDATGAIQLWGKNIMERTPRSRILLMLYTSVF